MPRFPTGPGPGLGLALLASLGLLAACAVVEPPPGGPEDTTPPQLLAFSPDSGAVGLRDVRVFTFRFSEKMDRQPATAWLHFFPDQRVRRTKWHGAVEAEVELEEPLPADTTVVVEVAKSLADAHKVRARRTRRYPIATGDSIPTGSISGVLVMGDSAVVRGVVELYAVPPDTLTLADMTLLRRASTDAKGAYTFSWLPVPGGPWLLRAFVDGNQDLRPGDKEPKRVLPDTLVLTAAEPAAAAGVVTLYPTNTPGRLLVRPFAMFGNAEPVEFFTQIITDADTGWAPQPVAKANFHELEGHLGGAVPEVTPGLNRLVAFLDVNRDSTLDAVPAADVFAYADSFAWQVSDPDADTTGWYLEPLVVTEAPRVEPGLDTWMSMPDSIPVLTPWPEPPPAPADTAAVAPADSAGTAPADSSGAEENR